MSESRRIPSTSTDGAVRWVPWPGIDGVHDGFDTSFQGDNYWDDRSVRRHHY